MRLRCNDIHASTDGAWENARGGEAGARGGVRMLTARRKARLMGREAVVVRYAMGT